MATEKRLIDANKVINAMQKCLDEEPDKKGSIAYFAFESIIECLKQEPTVDAVEVVHAHWIPDDYYDICSHCNHPVVLHDRRKPDRYCRNCGAKMDGGSYG